MRTKSSCITLRAVQLAIPHAPRPVRLRQVPGAVRRLSLISALCLVGVAACGGLASLLARLSGDEARFLDTAQLVQGRVVRVDRSEGPTSQVTAIYELGGRQQSAAVEVDTEMAAGLGRGASLELLVDPSAPGAPRHGPLTVARARRSPLIVFVLAMALTVAVLLVLRELRRSLRREVEPLRTGLLVWLTPDEPLPRTRGPFAFKASYYRDDVKHAVLARADGRRLPVRNAEKLLAAVAPGEPTWVRVVDEEVARSLGWYRDGV